MVFPPRFEQTLSRNVARAAWFVSLAACFTCLLVSLQRAVSE